MDKRTILFVVSLSITLMFVNWFFDSQRQEERKEWVARQKAVKEKQIDTLQQEMQQQTLKIKDLPVANAYSDKDKKEQIAQGVLVEESFLVISWSEKLPETIFTSAGEMRLVLNPMEYGEAALYQKGKPSPIKVAELPLFDRQDLQIFFPPTEKSQAQVLLGTYTDGQFSLPAAELNTLYQDLNIEQQITVPPVNGIVLMKQGEKLLPAAIFQRSSGELVNLEQVTDIETNGKTELFVEDSGEKKESYYVLENDYQQLVFSSKGGALAEINLPFQSDKNRKSIVKEIGFDREMVAQHPYNARFPLKPYYTAGDEKEHKTGKLGGYYPLIRRDLIQGGKRPSIAMQPRFYALNLVSESRDPSEVIYSVKSFSQNSITFEGSQKDRKITKTFSFVEDAPYTINLTVQIEGRDKREMWLTSGIPEVEWISNGPAPALKYRLTRNQKSEVVDMSLPEESITISTLSPDWVTNSNGFLGSIIDPVTEIDAGLRAQKISGTAAPSRLVLIDQDYQRFNAEKLPGYLTMLPLTSRAGQMKFRIYAGPFADKTLHAVDQVFSDPETGYNPDYIASQSTHGIFTFISAPFSKLLFVLMNFFHSITGSWGFSIILLTVALRIMLYPLNAWSVKSTLKMQEIAPEMQKIQAKHKKDPKKAQLEIMNLYRDRGINPVSGCFPMLIQMPFLIGMFDLLKSTFALRGATFIPGWINNLAAPDVLFSWSQPIFYIGTEFHLLPVLLGGVMFIQQKFMSPGARNADPSQMTDQQRQQKAMGTFMTVIFTVMFYHFPSGLNIYWISSMLLGVLQQWWTSNRMQTSKQSNQEKTIPIKQKQRG